MDGGLRGMDFIKERLPTAQAGPDEAVYFVGSRQWFPTFTDAWENDPRDAYREDLIFYWVKG